MLTPTPCMEDSVVGSDNGEQNFFICKQNKNLENHGSEFSSSNQIWFESSLYQFVIATPGRQDVWTVVLLLAVHHNLEDHPRVLQCVEHEAQGYSHLNHKHRKLILVNRE